MFTWSRALLIPSVRFHALQVFGSLARFLRRITVYISPWFLVYPPLYIAGIYNHNIRNRRDFSARVSGLDPMSVIRAPHLCEALATQLFKHDAFPTKAVTSAKFRAM